VFAVAFEILGNRGQIRADAQAAEVSRKLVTVRYISHTMARVSARLGSCIAMELPGC
jgi:hypothetical protein